MMEKDYLFWLAEKNKAEKDFNFSYAYICRLKFEQFKKTWKANVYKVEVLKGFPAIHLN